MSRFVRSSFSHADSEDLVEVDLHGVGFITLRAGGSFDHPETLFSPHEWAEFIRGVKAGEFDLPSDHGWPADALEIQSVKTEEASA